MARWPEKVYTTYKQMCEASKKDPMPEKEFIALFKKQQRILSYMINLGRETPWVISPIDNKFSLHAGVKGQNVSVNILTQEEIQAFGVGEAGGKKRSSI